VDRDELENYHVFTYTFGDNNRLYTRGQFTAHRNDPDTNTVWTRCRELTQNLHTELWQHTGVTERCYAMALAKAPDLRVKFVPKAFSDFGDQDKVFVFDRRVVQCPGASSRELSLCHALLRADSDTAQHVFQEHLSLQGKQVVDASAPPFELAFTKESCASWWTNFRVCVVFPVGVDPAEYSVELVNGHAKATRVRNTHPHSAVLQEAAFVHFQTWKARKAWKHPLAFPEPWGADDEPSASAEVTHLDAFAIHRHGLTPMSEISSVDALLVGA
jgi:hypothetical protein